MKVVIGLPSYGHAWRQPMRTLAELIAHNPTWTPIGTEGCANADVARCVITHLALEQNADAIIWIDSDISFPLWLPQQLLAHALQKLAVIGATYARKEEGTPQCIPYDMPIVEGELVDVERVGFGLCVTPRAILEAVGARLRFQTIKNLGRVKPYFVGDPLWDELVSDDYAFCKRVRLTGLPIYAYTTRQVIHWGPHGYSL